MQAITRDINLVLTSSIIMGMRGGTLVSRFVLTIFITQTMGLSDLGMYGLVLGAAALVPSVLGLGLNGQISRYVVDIHLAAALPHMATQFAFTAIIYLFVLPIALCVNAAMGFVVPWPLALWVGLLVCLEHASNDMHNQLVSRRRPTLAAVILFLRGGAWPVLFMCLAITFPALRNMEILMLCWLAGGIAPWLVVMVYLVQNRRWHCLKLQNAWLEEHWPKAYKFYLQDIGNTGYQFLDRFIMAQFLGLEATGVYTFFWSIANAVFSLIDHGVVGLYVPFLVGAAKRGDAEEFRRNATRLRRETWLWSVSISFCLLAAIPFLLRYLGRTQLEASLWVFWVIILAMLLRIASDNFSLMLYATGRDWARTFVALGGLVASGVFAGLLTPLFGLAGVSSACLATSIVLLCSSYGSVALLNEAPNESRGASEAHAATSVPRRRLFWPK